MLFFRMIENYFNFYVWLLRYLGFLCEILEKSFYSKNMRVYIFNVNSYYMIIMWMNYGS